MALAKEKGLVMAEAMTIYHMPLYKKLREILDAGTLGKVNLLTMNFGSFKEYDENNRFSIATWRVVPCLTLVFMHYLLFAGSGFQAGPAVVSGQNCFHRR